VELVHFMAWSMKSSRLQPGQTPGDRLVDLALVGIRKWPKPPYSEALFYSSHDVPLALRIDLIYLLVKRKSTTFRCYFFFWSSLVMEIRTQVAAIGVNSSVPVLG
jgi:hypothetical protein